MGRGVTDLDQAVMAWNMLGGLDWAGLDTVVEILGVRDPEMLVRRLILIRDHKARERKE